MKKIINNDFTIPVDSIQYFRIITGTNNETKETDYLVIAILKGNNAAIDLNNNPNVIILNLNDNNEGFKTKKEAVKFKDILENRIDNNFSFIYLSDILDDVNKYFESCGERKHTMTDLGHIPVID